MTFEVSIKGSSDYEILEATDSDEAAEKYLQEQNLSEDEFIELINHHDGTTYLYKVIATEDDTLTVQHEETEDPSHKQINTAAIDRGYSTLKSFSEFGKYFSIFVLIFSLIGFIYGFNLLNDTNDIISVIRGEAFIMSSFSIFIFGFVYIFFLSKMSLVLTDLSENILKIKEKMTEDE